MESSKTITVIAAALVLALLVGAGALLGLFDQGGKSPSVQDTAMENTRDPKTETPSSAPPGGLERPKPVEASKFQPPQPPSPEAFLGDGPRVAGRVVNERGDGIAGAELRLIRDLSQVRSQSQLGEILTRTQSKSDGSFSMPVERNAYFVIQAVHDSYASVLSGHVDPQTPESLNQTIRMQSGYPVMGMVSLMSGVPVDGAAIVVYDISKQVGQGQSEPHPERTATSSADGRFTLQHLTPGLKRVLVTKRGLATDGVNAYTVKESTTNPEIHFVLDAGLSIAGRVLDARTQLPVAGAEVTGRAVAMSGARARELPVELPAEQRGEEGDPDETRSQGFEQAQQAREAMQRFRDRTFLNLTAVTDENGRFVLEGALEARYQITTIARGYQRHSGTGANAGDQDVLIPLTPSARISGTCVDSQTGLPVKTFQLVLSPTPDPQYFPIQGRQNFEDEEGKFVFTDARIGDAYLVARAPGYAGGIGGPFAVVAEGIIDGAVVLL
ncbi:MAG TPA: carboxypeptidase-like regulatory domain-containing protein, partial [Planctomycetota bacterium]|nr:carboxypeptidase-like regulatory domain-containing protein [Planctomycetota bacterium]